MFDFDTFQLPNIKDYTSPNRWKYEVWKMKVRDTHPGDLLLLSSNLFCEPDANVISYSKYDCFSDLTVHQIWDEMQISILISRTDMSRDDGPQHLIFINGLVGISGMRLKPYQYIFVVKSADGAHPASANPHEI